MLQIVSWETKILVIRRLSIIFGELGYIKLEENYEQGLPDIGTATKKAWLLTVWC